MKQYDYRDVNSDKVDALATWWNLCISAIRINPSMSPITRNEHLKIVVGSLL